MKNSLSVVAIVMLAAVFCLAANNSSSPAAPAGVSQPSTLSVAQTSPAPATALAPGEGSPIPWCPPHENCPDDVRTIAGEGSPIPWCPPHENCPDNVRTIAGEGSPIPWCPPHENCPDDLRQPGTFEIALVAVPETHANQVDYNFRAISITTYMEKNG